MQGPDLLDLWFKKVEQSDSGPSAETLGYSGATTSLAEVVHTSSGPLQPMEPNLHQNSCTFQGHSVSEVHVKRKRFSLSRRPDHGASRRPWRLLMPAVALATTWLMAAPASADTWPYSPHPPDRGTHTFCFASEYMPNTIVQGAAFPTFDNIAVQTVVNVEYHGTCKDGTDARVGQQDLGNTIFGETTCVLLNSNSFCDRWRVRINYSLINSYSSTSTATTNGVRKTVCHEVGHTLGLAHYGNGDPYFNSPDGSTNSCMISGYQGGGQAWTRTYGPHHVGHINAWWS